MSKKNYVIGIDLGTTNSAVSIIEGGQPVIIANAEGRRTTPSVVAFTANGERKIGDPAKRQAVTNPTKTISSIKRFMGKDYKAIANEIKNIPFKVIENPQHLACVDIDGRIYPPQEISAMILSKLKQTAEEFLGQDVTDAVITVPAYFGDAERTATMEAGKIAGLNVLRIINEPTAAALAYGLDKKDKEQKICVFDCGGGTHDVSVLEIGDGVFEVKSTDGDTHLGGDDFDQKIIQWMLDEFQKDNALDISKDPMALQRFKDAAEKAKIELSSAAQTEINLPYVTARDGAPIHFAKTLTRAKFEAMISELIDRAVNCAKSALKAAGLSASDIDEVILVGGSTRIPKIQEEVEKLFNKKANKSVNPDEVVAIGAAIQGAVLQGDITDVLLLDVTPLSIGIETMGGVFTKLIEANTTIPTKKSETFSTASDNQSSVEIHVLQGERPMAKDNKSLGRFHLDGIMSAPRGVPQIEVSLDLDSNSILTITAKDKATGKVNTIRIEGGSKLSKEDIEAMRRDAEINADADKKEKEKVDKLNQADSLIFQTEKQIKEHAEKISEANKTDLNSALEELKESHKSGDLDKLDGSINKMNETWNKVSTEMYQNSPKDEVTDETKGDNNTVDADYEEVK